MKQFLPNGKPVPTGKPSGNAHQRRKAKRAHLKKKITILDVSVLRARKQCV